MPFVTLLFHDVYRRHPSESGFGGSLAHRYKLHARAFDAILMTLDRVRLVGSAALLTGASGLVPSDGVAFTVDDGGRSYYTAIADSLERHGWRGHCFVSTNAIGTPGFLSAAEIRELDRRGHVIGTHSATHPTRFSACPWPRMLEEWQSSRKTLEDTVGHEVAVASLPGGYLSSRVARSAAEAGLRVLFTSEPEARVRDRNGCLLVGRYAIKPGCAPDSVRALVEQQPLAVWREWAVWNTKKVAKPLAGAAYPRLGAWFAQRFSRE